MGVRNNEFEGISTNIPGVYTKSEFPPSKGASGAATNIVAVIGSCNSGTPYNANVNEDVNKVNRITSVAEALDVLRGGSAYYMTEFYLSPSKEAILNSPTECLVFKVDPSDQATGVLQDVGTNDIIDLIAARYGTISNQLARKVEAGTNIGHKVTVKFQGEIIAEEDDVGFEYMAIQYTGAGTAASMNISATQLDVTVTGASGDDLTILFADFAKLGDLVEYINEQPNYTCRLLGSSDTNTTTFDAVTSQDILTAEYTAEAIVEALIQFFNSQCQNEVIAELSSGATRTDVVNDSGFVFFTGGSKGTASATDWANCLALMEKFKINHILVASGDTTYHAMVDAHCLSMSGIEGKRNRTSSSGAIAGLSITERINEMKAQNAARAEYCVTPFKRADAVNNNAVTEFAPFYGAALVAGIKYGNNVTISATFKSVNVLGLTESYSDAEIKRIIGAGGTLFTEEERGFVVKHNVTTYQGTNLILNLPSMLRTADAITLDSQARITNRLAEQTEAANSLIIIDMKNYLETNLLPEYRDEKRWLTDDPINGDPAFSDTQFKLEGDAFYFSFTGIIPAPLHFGFIKQKFVVTGSR